VRAVGVGRRNASPNSIWWMLLLLLACVRPGSKSAQAALVDLLVVLSENVFDNEMKYWLNYSVVLRAQVVCGGWLGRLKVPYAHVALICCSTTNMLACTLGKIDMLAETIWWKKNFWIWCWRVCSRMVNCTSYSGVHVCCHA
jgi:hypothetical protein